MIEESIIAENIRKMQELDGDPKIGNRKQRRAYLQKKKPSKRKTNEKRPKIKRK